MKEADFRIFLLCDSSITSEKAVISRIAKARKAESILGKSLDTVVGDDDIMFESLKTLQTYEDPKHNPLQNAVRKYYKFINKKEFPRKNDYHSFKHL